MFEKHELAVIIGRFQIPHYGHFELIKRAQELAEKVLVLVGSANLPVSLRNPFSANERISMIEHANIDLRNVVFKPLKDFPYFNQRWIEEVQKSVESNYDYRIGNGLKDIVLVGCKKEDTDYLDSFPQWKYYGVDQKKLYSATDLRNAYYQYGTENKSVMNVLHDYTTQGVIEALRFIPSHVWGNLHNRFNYVKQYQKEWGYGPHYTADAVVIKDGHVLVIERGEGPDEGKLALPGGFLDVNEDSYKAAVRELKEETSLGLSWYENEERQYLVGSEKFEGINRDDRGDIRTTAHCFVLPSGGGLPVVKAASDAKNAMWVPLIDLTPDMYADHYFIIRKMIASL